MCNKLNGPTSVAGDQLTIIDTAVEIKYHECMGQSFVFHTHCGHLFRNEINNDEEQTKYMLNV